MLLDHLNKKGVYSLIIQVNKHFMSKVKTLGLRDFFKGTYVYTGSAMGLGGIRARIKRHLYIDRKKNHSYNPFWHIDFLVANKNATITAIITKKTSINLECEMNQYIKENGRGKIPIPSFGASDCRKGCKSHLLYFKRLGIESEISKLYSEKLHLKEIKPENLWTKPNATKVWHYMFPDA